MSDWTPRRFRFIAFDWDGTLADSTGIITEAIRHACADVGEPVPDENAARYVIGLGLADALRHVAPGLPASRHDELTERYREYYLARDSAIPLFAGVRELLDELRQAGFLLGVATGKSRRGLERAMDTHGLIDQFVATRCGDEGFPKPHPDMLLHLIDRVGVAPAETLMIGDTTHDIALAHAAGAACVAVGYGAHAPEQLARLGPLATVGSVRELRGWLYANA